MNPDHLLEIAELILQSGARYPRQAAINRAVSTAYYALFHALCSACVAQMVGSPRTPCNWQIITPIYRAVEHGSARKVFDRLARDTSASGFLKEISRIFIDLQSARIAADYDPASRCTRGNALDFVAQARRGVDALRALPKDDQLLLAIQLITKQR